MGGWRVRYPELLLGGGGGVELVGPGGGGDELELGLELGECVDLDHVLEVEEALGVEEGVVGLLEEVEEQLRVLEVPRVALLPALEEVGTLLLQVALHIEYKSFLGQLRLEAGVEQGEEADVGVELPLLARADLLAEVVVLLLEAEGIGSTRYLLYSAMVWSILRWSMSISCDSTILASCLLRPLLSQSSSISFSWLCSCFTFCSSFWFSFL